MILLCFYSTKVVPVRLRANWYRKLERYIKGFSPLFAEGFNWYRNRGCLAYVSVPKLLKPQIRQDYLDKAMGAAIKDAQTTQMKLAAKVAGGDETYRVARDSAQKKVKDLQERYKNKRGELDYLKIVSFGRVTYLGSALVHPAPIAVAQMPGMKNDPEVEAFAMTWVMDHERQRGWEPEDVSKNHDGSGFDIRSVGPIHPETEISPVRRIEVKGRAQGNQEVSLTSNEWRKAQQLGDSYWLYVVWGCKTSEPQLLKIQNPAKVLVGDAKEIRQVTRYLVPAEALQRNALTGVEVGEAG